VDITIPPRIHRATLLNLRYVEEVSSGFGGGLIARLNDGTFGAGANFFS